MIGRTKIDEPLAGDDTLQLWKIVAKVCRWCNMTWEIVGANGKKGTVTTDGNKVIIDIKGVSPGSETQTVLLQQNGVFTVRNFVVE